MASLIKRNGTFYVQYCVGGKAKRQTLRTDSLQIAKEKLRQFESAQFRGDDLPFPTRTPIGEVVKDYVKHLRTVKTARSVRSDLFYLRSMFGPVCEDLKAIHPLAQPLPPIEANAFEEITTRQVAEFLTRAVRERNYAPKTSNRYREIVMRLFNWSTKHRGIRLPNDRNPIQRVERYKDKAQTIRFLTLEQIDQQMEALADHPQLRAMVAVFIYAGLRREEAVWLTRKDVDFNSGPHGVIHVRAKTIDGEYWQPKTKINRVVPISQTLRKHLGQYEPRIVPGLWFFPSPGGRRWDADNFSRYHRPIQENHKLLWNCLDYRHTFGSQLAMKGESLYKIATLMGNSADIVRRHYAALEPDSLTGAVEFRPSREVQRAQLQIKP